MTELFAVLAVFLTLISSITTLVIRDPINKLITLSILVSGAIILIVNQGYLDVAIIISLLMPVETLFILLLCCKKQGDCNA